MVHTHYLIIIIIALYVQTHYVNSQINNLINESYTEAEQVALKELRQALTDVLYLDYQKEDVYLINWLRNKKLEVGKAKDAIENSLQIRREKNIDNVLKEEEMKTWHRLYPATFGKAIDKFGRPAYQVPFGAWDIRKAMLTGKRDTLNRYVFFIFESITTVMREMNAPNWIFLADMSNYNLRKHACLACLPYYIDLVGTYERHYPNSATYIIAVNTPRIFEAVSNLMLPLMSEETQKVYKIFGPNKEEWQKFVLNIFPAEQLTRQYGGTKAS